MLAPETIRCEPRPCYLRDTDHKYVWEPTGEQMQTSVTSVTSFGKPPYSGPKEAGWRGDHIHLWTHHWSLERFEIDPVSPEGFDISDWIPWIKGLSLWDNCAVFASGRWSTGASR